MKKSSKLGGGLSKVVSEWISSLVPFIIMWATQQFLTKTTLYWIGFLMTITMLLGYGVLSRTVSDSKNYTTKVARVCDQVIVFIMVAGYVYIVYSGFSNYRGANKVIAVGICVLGVVIAIYNGYRMIKVFKTQN